MGKWYFYCDKSAFSAITGGKGFRNPEHPGDPVLWVTDYCPVSIPALRSLLIGWGRSWRQRDAIRRPAQPSVSHAESKRRVIRVCRYALVKAGAWGFESHEAFARGEICPPTRFRREIPPDQRAPFTEAILTWMQTAVAGFKTGRKALAFELFGSTGANSDNSLAAPYEGSRRYEDGGLDYCIEIEIPNDKVHKFDNASKDLQTYNDGHQTAFGKWVTSSEKIRRTQSTLERGCIESLVFRVSLLEAGFPLALGCPGT